MAAVEVEEIGIPIRNTTTIIICQPERRNVKAPKGHPMEDPSLNPSDSGDAWEPSAEGDPTMSHRKTAKVTSFGTAAEKVSVGAL